MATIDEIAERAARDVRVDVRPVTDVNAGLAAILGRAEPRRVRRAWTMVGWAVALTAVGLVVFFVARDGRSGRTVPATTPVDTTVSAVTTIPVESTIGSVAPTSTVSALPGASCDAATLQAAVAAVFPDRPTGAWTGVTVDACTRGFAQVVAIADQSNCPVAGVECFENQRFWFQDINGTWTYLASGTGIGCSADEMTPAIVPACAAFAENGVDPRLSFDRIDIPAPHCVSEVDCTNLLATREGRLASYSTTDGVLRFLDDAVSLPIEIDGRWIAHPITFGPEDVLYLWLSDRTSGESGGLVAVATEGPEAGSIVASSENGVDTSGDSTLVSTAAGLVQVGCCGGATRQPALDERLSMAWVGQDGAPLAPLDVDVWIEYASDGVATLVRSDRGNQTRWVLDSTIGGRDMPLVTPTEDGGVLLWQYDGFLAADVAPVLYDARADGTVQQYALPGYNYPAILHPARYVILPTAEGYVRADLP